LHKILSAGERRDTGVLPGKVFAEFHDLASFDFTQIGDGGKRRGVGGVGIDSVFNLIRSS